MLSEPYKNHFFEHVSWLDRASLLTYNTHETTVP